MVRWWRFALLSIGMLAITCLAGFALEIVGFDIDPQAPIVGQTITFTETTSGYPSGYITEYDWDFGDGTTVNVDANTHSVTHPFLQAGEYRVKLTVKDSRGGETTSTKTVVVSLPRADFSKAPSNPTTQDGVHFTGTAIPAQGVATGGWSWDFGDGTAGSDKQSPTHIFPNKGTYLVTLVVTYETGASAVKTNRLIVLNSPPIADFTFTPAEPKVGDSVTFAADGSSDPDGSIASYAWDFDGNGTFDIQGGPSARTVVHTFDRDGNYNVTLRVTDNEGKSSDKTLRVPVSWSVPVADFTIDPATPKVGEAVTFDASSSTDADGDGSIVSYEWDFDGNGTIDGNGKTINRVFVTAGTANVILAITDDTGLTNAKSVFFDVMSTPPTAAFTFTPANPNTGQVVSFDAKGSKDSDGTIILYEWNFGDGNPVATGLAVTHSYAAPGVYPVMLTVTDNDMEFDVTTQGVPVEMGGTGGVNQPPVADFTFAPANGPDVNLSEVVTFKADGCSDKDGSVAAYEWDFNNDGVYDATGTTVTHVFHRGGGQIVTLRVLDNEGAPGFKTEVVPVEFVRPMASFSFSPAEPRVGDVITFAGSSSSDADGRVEFYEWDFDNDGKVDATGMTVTHAFASGGSKPVTLKVTDNDGVSSSITKTATVAINNPPIANFAISPVGPTTADTITFEDTSIDNDGSIAAWNWDFGDGSTSTVQSPSHKYDSAKVYSVTLVVTDDEGAIGSVTQSITVSVPMNAPPVASFTFSPSLPQVGSAVVFSDTSTDSDGTITAWSWNFGDGTTGQVRNPSHTYSATGTYSVTLSVTDNDGAKSAVTKKQIQVAAAGAEVGLYSYPNPASRQASIVYYLPTGATEPVLRIYNITGALVFEQTLTVGESPYVWDLTSTDGTEQPNGLYLCVVVAKNVGGSTIKSPIFKLLIAR